MRLPEVGTFDSLNGFIIKGDPASGLSMLYATLLEKSADEPSAAYGYLAHNVEVAPDRSFVTFHLRPGARFHDGAPITAQDVIWSFETLRDKGLPAWRSYYHDVAKVEALDPHTVRFTLAHPENRELPLILGELPVMPRHYWEKRDFTVTTLEPPVGSGPYRIRATIPGRSVIFERVKDWWGADLPVNRGRWNFDIIRQEYFRDSTVALEAFLSGRYDLRVENVAKQWATGYDAPAVTSGAIRRVEIYNALPASLQGFVFNTRRPLFADRRVREALGLAFDFEWSNRILAYGLYRRTKGLFANTEMLATQPPDAREIAVLEPYRDRLPPEVFGPAWTPPVTDGSGWNRDALKRARDLLHEAGWVVKDY